MDKDIQLTLITTFGAGGLAGLASLVKVYLDYKSGKKKNREDKIVRAKISHHSLFSQLDELEVFFSRDFKLKDEGRTLLVSEMVVKKVRVWKRILLEASEYVQVCCENCTHGFDGKGCNKLENYMSSILIRGLEEYTDWHKVPGVTDVEGRIVYDADSIETMDLFVDKFKEWHASREEIVRLATHDITNSSVLYESCYNKMWDILSVYMYAFVEMKLDAEKTIKSLNGSLTGKKFLGVTIGDEV